MVGFVFLVLLYFYVVLRIAQRVPRGNFARSRAAKRLEEQVLDYVKILHELDINEDLLN